MKYHGTYNSRRGGFTLLEALVALVILATGIVAILLVFPAALERQRTNTLRTMTATTSQTQLNRLKAGDTTDTDFQKWLDNNRLKVLYKEVDPETEYIQPWVVSCQPMGEYNRGLYRVTLGLRLWDNRVEYYTTYVTDR